MQGGGASFQPPTAAPWAGGGPAAPHGPISGPLGPPPAPLSEPLPVVSLPHNFVIPQKRITSREGLEVFGRSHSGQLFLAFVASLSRAVENRKLSDEVPLSQACSAIMGVLDQLAAWVDDIPPAQQQARYGNPAYRFWQERLRENVAELQAAVLPPQLISATAELAPYFLDSFGNSSRIDYGTGHEANFLAWLFCLARLGVLTEADYPALVLRVFAKYLSLMRALVLRYWLEPAGSHGVWGLDDYHFLPFIFGSAQLVGHKYMRPKSIHTPDVLQQFENDYLYLQAVQFVKKVKKGPLGEHSPMLNDISGVPTWAKVNSGLLKMYRAEVLEKLPIMQHFLFGSIIGWAD